MINFRSREEVLANREEIIKNTKIGELMMEKDYEYTVFRFVTKDGWWFRSKGPYICDPDEWELDE